MRRGPLTPSPLPRHTHSLKATSLAGERGQDLAATYFSDAHTLSSGGAFAHWRSPCGPLPRPSPHSHAHSESGTNCGGEGAKSAEYHHLANAPDSMGFHTSVCSGSTALIWCRFWAVLTVILAGSFRVDTL